MPNFKEISALNSEKKKKISNEDEPPVVQPHLKETNHTHSTYRKNEGIMVVHRILFLAI